MYRHIRTALVFIPLSLLLFACATTPEPTVQTFSTTEVIDGSLHKVENASVAKAYVDPDFNIDDYEKILIEPLDVSAVTVTSADSAVSGTAWQLNENDRAYLVQRYRTSMIKNFFALGGYVAATGPGEGVLRIQVTLSRVGQSMSDSPGAGSITMRHRSSSDSGGGEIQITGIVEDSGTGNPVARFVDVRQSSSNWALSNELKSREDAERLFESWARLFVYRLQENRKMNRPAGKAWR